MAGITNSGMYGSVENFVRSQLELLELERAAEVEQCRELLESSSAIDLERKGVAVRNLSISSTCTGLYGRQLIVFESARKTELVSHSITSGDIVGVTGGSLDRSDFIASGVVNSVQRNCISVSFEQSEDLELEDEGQYCIVKLTNDVTYKRLKNGLNSLKDNCEGPANKLLSILFDHDEIKQVPLNPKLLDANGSVKFFNKHLNQSQQEAVIFALKQKELAIIHGPPGTGKTTTVVEFLLQCIESGNKILVCAPSNVAIDNLLEKLSQYKVNRIIRLGHPARMLPGIQKFSLDAVLMSRDNAKIIEDVKSDIDKTLAKLKKSKKDSRPKLRQEIKLFRKELRERESVALKEVLSNASVIVSTLTTASKDGPLKHLPDNHFDLVIIDECSQALESACWIPLQWVPKAVLAGDHLQLPPTIISEDAAKKGLEITLMERAIKKLGTEVVRMLTVQYRMHTDIMNWSSNKLYDGKLEAHPLVARHLLKDIVEIQDDEYTITPLLLIDTAGCDMSELETEDEVSKGNEGEADLVSIVVKHLVKNGLNPSDIAVITPYNLQVELIRARVHEYSGLEVRSVDGFQGREKEAVILSLVRSNSKGELGFVPDVRRLNVAVTRARRLLTVITDTNTVNPNPVLCSLVEHLEKFGVVHSAHQYQSELNTCEKPALNVKLAKTLEKSSKEVKPRNKATAKVKQKMSIRNQSNETIEAKDKSVALNTAKDPSEQNNKLELMIQEFIDNPTQVVYEFPSTLTSFERMLVHEIAEKQNLEHVSVGENRDRHIILRKKNVSCEGESSLNDSETLDVLADDNQNDSAIVSPIDVDVAGTSTSPKSKQKVAKQSRKDSTETQSNSQPPHDVKVCTYCEKMIPLSNIIMHELHCQSVLVRAEKKKKEKNLSDRTPDGENFDDLVKSFQKLNTKCSFPKCKTSTSMLGQNCEHCAKRYCISHSIPEVHGCGLEAKIAARKLIAKTGSLSAKEPKKLDPTKRNMLQRKLDKKLNEMSDSRKVKQKPKK